MVKGIDGLLTTAEAADYVGVKVQRIREYVSRGRRRKGIYRTKRTGDKLVPDAYIGQSPMFSTATLDTYFGLKPTRRRGNPDRDT